MSALPELLRIRHPAKVFCRVCSMALGGRQHRHRHHNRYCTTFRMLLPCVSHVTVVAADLHEVRRSESFDRYGPWSKDNPLHRKQAMKIITPCYPQANTTMKVLNLQLLAIKTELYRGWGLTQKIVEARGPNQGAAMAEYLDQLLSPFNFFDRYTHYAVIKATAETQVAPRALRIL